MEPKKNPKADLEKKRNVFFQIGLIVSLGIVLLAFEWKSYDEVNYSLGQLKTEDVPEEIIPITKQEVKPPPPPLPVPVVLNVVKNDVEIKNEAKVEETEATQETKVEVREIATKQEEVDETTIFTIVESMPTFPGCENAGDEQKKQECFSSKIQQYLGNNIKYPPIAKDNNMTGTVYISFVISTSGSVKDIKVLRGLGGGCEEEAMRVVQGLPKFTPGKQRGKPVQVQYTLPIKFTLK